MNRLATVRSLQQRITEMQPLRMRDEVVPTAPQLRALLPSGGLRKGAATSVRGSQQLALALLTHASASGAWCGAIGLPGLGVEAAARLGVSLDRFPLVPNPGAHALSIAGMLSEVCAVLLLRTSTRPSPAETERLGARLREHGTALIVLGTWARNESTLRVTHSRWFGLGEGHGALDTQELLVQSMDRRGQHQHRVRFHEGKLVSPTVPRIKAMSS